MKSSQRRILLPSWDQGTSRALQQLWGMRVSLGWGWTPTVVVYSVLPVMMAFRCQSRPWHPMGAEPCRAVCTLSVLSGVWGFGGDIPEGQQRYVWRCIYGRRVWSVFCPSSSLHTHPPPTSFPLWLALQFYFPFSALNIKQYINYSKSAVYGRHTALVCGRRAEH